MAGMVVADVGSSFITQKVAVLTTSVRITQDTQSDRKRIKVFNNGPNPIYVGPDSTVTTGTGFPVPAGTSAEFRLRTSTESHGTAGQLWAIAGTASQTSPLDTRVYEEQ